MPTQEYINQVVCGDCVEVMKHFDDNSIDMVLTSPPYDNLRTYDGYDLDFESILEQLYRIVKVGGVVVWVVNDACINRSESGNSFRQAIRFQETGFNIHDTMIYQKNSYRFPDPTRYYQCFEYMFVFSKNQPPKTVNLIKDRKNKYCGHNMRRKNGKRNKNGERIPLSKNKSPLIMEKYGVRGNVWKYKTGLYNTTRDKIAYKHPAIFPEQLAQDHILTWSNPLDIVLDPMCGSGTTLKMAVLNNRKFIGIDVSQKYCEISKERIKGVIEQRKII